MTSSVLDYRRNGSRDFCSKLQPYTAAGTSWNSVRWAKPSAGYRNSRAETNQRVFASALSSTNRSRLDQYNVSTKDKSSIDNKNSSSISGFGDYRLRTGSASKSLFTGSKVINRTSAYKSPYSSTSYSASYSNPSTSTYSANRYSSAPSCGRRSSVGYEAVDSAPTSRRSSRRNSLCSSTAALETDLSKLSQFVTDLRDNTRSMTTNRYSTTLSSSWPNDTYNSASRRSSVSRDVSGTNLNSLLNAPSASSITNALDTAFTKAAARVNSETGFYSRYSNLSGTDKWESMLSEDRRPLADRRQSTTSSRLTDSGFYTANNQSSTTSLYSSVNHYQKPLTNRLTSGRISRFLKPKEKRLDDTDPSFSSSDDNSKSSDKKRTKKKRKERKNSYTAVQKSSSDEEPSSSGYQYKGSTDYKIMSRRRRLNKSKALLSEDAVWKPCESSHTYKYSRSTEPSKQIELPAPAQPDVVTTVTAPMEEVDHENHTDTARVSPLPPPRSGFSQSPVPPEPLSSHVHKYTVDLRPLNQIERELTPKLYASCSKLAAQTNDDAVRHYSPFQREKEVISASSSKINLSTSLQNCEQILAEAKAQLLQTKLPTTLTNTYSAKNATVTKIDAKKNDDQSDKSSGHQKSQVQSLMANSLFAYTPEIQTEKEKKGIIAEVSQPQERQEFDTKDESCFKVDDKKVEADRATAEVAVEHQLVHKTKPTPAKRLVVLHSDDHRTEAAISAPFPQIMSASYDDDVNDEFALKKPAPVKRTHSAGQVEIDGMKNTQKTSPFLTKLQQQATAPIPAHSITALPTFVPNTKNTSPLLVPSADLLTERPGSRKSDRAPSLQQLIEEFNEEVNDTGRNDVANKPAIVNQPIKQQGTSIVQVPVELKAAQQSAAVCISRSLQRQPPEPWRQISRQLKTVDKDMLDLVTLGEELNGRHTPESSLSQISDSGFQTPEVVDSLQQPQTALIFDSIPNVFDYSMKFTSPTEKERIQAATAIGAHLRKEKEGISGRDFARQASQDSIATGSFATAPSEVTASNDSLPMLPSRAQVMSKPQSLRASIERIPRPTFGLIIAQSNQQDDIQKAPAPQRAQLINTCTTTGESIFALGVSSGMAHQTPRNTFAGSMPIINRTPSLERSRGPPLPWRMKGPPDARMESHHRGLPATYHAKANGLADNVSRNIKESSLETAVHKVDQMLTLARNKEHDAISRQNYNAAHQISSSHSNISKYQAGKELSLEPLNNIQEEFRRESQMIRKYYGQRDDGKEQHWLYPDEPAKAQPERAWAIVGNSADQSYRDGRQLFTSKWLHDDLDSLKMVDPVKPDLLQFGPRDADQRSIGSCSAEIAMIISKDKRQEVARRRRMQQVPDIVPQKHQAVIKPSPVKFSSYQDIYNTAKPAPEPPIRKDSFSSVDSARQLLDRYLQPKLWQPEAPQSAKPMNGGSRNSIRSDGHFIRNRGADQKMSNHMSKFVKRFESYDMLNDRKDKMAGQGARTGAMHNHLGVYAESTHSLPVDITNFVHHPKLLSETRQVHKLSHSSLESGADSNSTLTEGVTGHKFQNPALVWNAKPHIAPQLRPGGDLLDAVDNLVAELELNTEEAESKKCAFPTQPVPRGGYDIVTCDDTPKANRKYQPAPSYAQQRHQTDNAPEGVYGSLPALPKPVHQSRHQQPLHPFTLSNKWSPTGPALQQRPFQTINDERIAESKVCTVKQTFEKRGPPPAAAQPLPAVTAYRPVSLSSALSPSAPVTQRSPFQQQQHPVLHHQFMPISSVIPFAPTYQPPIRPFSNPDDILDATVPLGVYRKKRLLDNDDDDYDNLPPAPIPTYNPKQMQARALLNEVLHVNTAGPADYRAGLHSPNGTITIESHVLNSPRKTDASSSKNIFKNFFRMRKGDGSSSSRDASNLSLQQQASPQQVHPLHKTSSYADHESVSKKSRKASKFPSWMTWRKN